MCFRLVLRLEICGRGRRVKASAEPGTGGGDFRFNDSFFYGRVFCVIRVERVLCLHVIRQSVSTRAIE